MADSDDDYDSRGRERDKFRRERNDLNDRQRSRDNRGSGNSSYERRRNDNSSWDSRRSGRKRSFDYRDYDRSSHSRSGRGVSPPPSKRHRNWDDNMNPFYRDDFDRRPPPMPYQEHHHRHQHPMHVRYMNEFQYNSPQDNYSGISPGGSSSISSMMSFKQFLNTLNDEINEEEAIKKYNEYKADYKRTHCKKFFMIHKDEEWFRQKYHPVDSKSKTTRIKENVHKRLIAFMEFYTSGRLQNVRMFQENAASVVHLLDGFVIRLEGGGEEDLKALDEEFKRQEERQRIETQSVQQENNKHDSEGSDKEEEDGEFEAIDDNEEPNFKQEPEADEGYAEENDDADEVVEQPDDTSANKVEVPETGEISDNNSRKFHKNLSIFVRTLSPNITKSDIESIASQHEGYIRVAVGEVMPEKRFCRHAWITCDSSVNIRSICAQINGSRVGKYELNATINRQLNRRVRPVSGYAAHKPCVENDIKLASELAKFLDKRKSLWSTDKSETGREALTLNGNPILNEIDKLDLSELQESQEENGGSESDVVVNEDLIKVLDKILLYLRMVHSFDFYGGTEYVHEDEMPHRCGIISVRGRAAPKVLPNEIKYWKDNMTKKIRPRFQEAPANLTDEECELLGLKDPDKYPDLYFTEVEAFVKDNTKELSAEKWLCPLSGKKFRGPEFVRKHIFNKHADKVDEVKAEVEFLNNFLRDPNRPEEIDSMPYRRNVPGNPRGPPPPPLAWPGPVNWGPPAQPPMMLDDGNRGPPFGSYGGAPLRPRMGPGPSSRFRTDPRKILSYNDLDAPDEKDLY